MCVCVCICVRQSAWVIGGGGGSRLLLLSKSSRLFFESKASSFDDSLSLSLSLSEFILLPFSMRFQKGGGGVSTNELFRV